MRVSVPNQHPTKMVNFPRLDGGLNLWELDYRLDNNQSPEMKNLWWQDGVLQCRDGQEYIVTPNDLGEGYACAPSLFWDKAFFHIGEKLYYTDPDAATRVLTEVYTGVTENRGTFFRYGDDLFYKNRGSFIRIEYTPDGDALFVANDISVNAYTPITVLNADPTTGSGDLYQPENRLSDKKTVKYNAKKVPGEDAKDDEATYHLPVKLKSTEGTELGRVERVVVDGKEITSDEYAVDLEKGLVVFVKAPPVHDPPVNNTVEITYSLPNPDARKAIMDCPYAFVHGGGQNLCILLGGSEKQPNAFFWNSNDAVSMNPTYWPMPYYQLAGDTEDPVTGFGQQYGTLVVFKERSVGRSDFSTVSLEGRDSLSFTYTNINTETGCDLPWSIQLVENNLVFCNTYGGVHMIRDSSSALENNVECLSRNVNGSPARPGLLEDVRAVDKDAVCSVDDDNRYWICANGHVYLWDYLLSTWREPSWFYFNNVRGVAYFRDVEKLYHMDAEGGVTRFRRIFADYNAAIEKVYQFPPQFFDTYERLKDILDCIFVVRSDTDTDISIQYQTDYETREDLTTLESYSWRLFPRNLNYRHLAVQKFATSARRRPGCRHVRHFAMRLSNNQVAQDLAVVSAQIHFRYTGKDR